ncbi:membrane protein [Rhizobium sp. NBRC 114257]|uniref:Membrane protein n=1 Tax=Rhizobium dioscoreae TaxID=2653122 RepID=A0ABQ0ZCV1_9HYPH|nr:membrane protein [Rhizobium dioscoreae]GLU84834.1 membrane protein [Rhizobium sp. NBRC 114257]
MTSSSRSARKNPYYQGPVSDHFDGQRFFNPGGVAPGDAFDLLRWQLGGGRVRWPNPVISAFPLAKPDRHVFGNQMRVTMVGHASMLVQIAGLNVLTDPVWSERVSPFRSVGPKRVVPPGIRFEDLPHIDLVLVTHNHYDHLDLVTLARLQQAHRPKIVTPLGNDTIIRRAVPDADITVVDWGDRIALKAGVTIDAEPCHHWSARGMGDRRMALWAAFVLNTPAGKIYHVGDTGFHDGINYEAARQKHGGFRLAILPFGAYEPRWFMKGQHQNPEEAVKGMKLCNAAYVAGHHFATFQLTDGRDRCAGAGAGCRAEGRGRGAGSLSPAPGWRSL